MWLLPQLRALWLGVHLLALIRGAVIRSTNDCALGESWCQDRCSSDTSGDTCCQTPNGQKNLCPKGTICCMYGCCPSGTTCNSEGGCDGPNPIPQPSSGVDVSTVAIGSLHDVPTSLNTLHTTTVHRTTTECITAISSDLSGSPGSSGSDSEPIGPVTTTLPDGNTVISSSGVLIIGTDLTTLPNVLSKSILTTDGETFTLQPAPGKGPEPTPGTIGSGPLTTTLPDGNTIVSSSGIILIGTDSITLPKVSFQSVLTTDGETFTLLPPSSGGSGETGEPSPSGPLTSTLLDGNKIVSASGVIVSGTNSITVPTVASPTTLTTDGETFTFLPAPTLPTNANPASVEVMTVFPDGKTAISRSGLIIVGADTMTALTGLAAPTTITTDGETFTFLPAPALPTNANPARGDLTTVFPDGKTVISRSGLIFIGSETLMVPTGLTAPTTIITDGETFTFLPAPALPTNANPAPGELTTTFPNGKTAISRSGLIFIGDDTITVPTGLTAPTTITTDGETFTFGPQPASNAEPTTTDVGPLPIYTTWPAEASITPIVDNVDSFRASGGGSDTPCKLWFFFICIQSIDINIGGWFWHLSPGIYPPGPPPPGAIKLPPGITIQGQLPPWPKFTVGPNSIPTFSSEPDKTQCKTESALLCATTTSVDASTTNVASTCATILGCDVTDSATAITNSAIVTTDSCSPTTVTDFFVSCSSSSCVTTSSSLVTGCTVTASATTTSVADEGPFCELDVAIPEDAIEDPEPCIGCATVSGLLIATPIPTGLTSLNVLNHINPNDQATALDARGVALVKRVDEARPLIKPANYNGRNAQSKFIKALNQPVNSKGPTLIGISPPRSPEGTTGQGQLDLWKIDNIGIGVTAELHRFDKTPKTYKLRGLSGCTVAFIVSSKGLWAGHWWESTKTLINSGSSFNARLDAKVVKERDDDEFDRIAVKILAQKTPDNLLGKIGFVSLADLIGSDNDIFANGNDVKIFILTKATSDQDSSQKYRTKVNLLKDALKKLIPGAEYNDLTYVGIEDSKKPTGSYSGELHLQYTPYEGTGKDGCTQMAAARLWAEVYSEVAIAKDWPALDEQKSGLQNRQACELYRGLMDDSSPVHSKLTFPPSGVTGLISSITPTTSVATPEPTGTASAPPLPKLSSQTTPAGNNCLSTATVTSCQKGPDPDHRDVACVTTTNCAKFAPTSSAKPEPTVAPVLTNKPAPKPTQAPLAPLAVGDQHCFDEEKFAGHQDVHGDQQTSGAEFICQNVPDDLSPSSKPFLEVGRLTQTPYWFQISWIDGCKTTVATQSGKTPIGSNGSPDDVTCQKLLEGNYNNCNNGGVGGYIDVGCLRYIFEPCNPDERTCGL